MPNVSTHLEDELALEMARLAQSTDAHLPISAVDAGGNHIDDHLTRPRDRIRQIAVLQHLRPALPAGAFAIVYRGWDQAMTAS
jgi:hypothetical protein